MSEERRNRLIPDRRRSVLTRYRASGETQRAFCEDAGVSVSTLHTRVDDAARSYCSPSL
jgi:DNA-directed RNA polymerase specialized sigma24 family protein